MGFLKSHAHQDAIYANHVGLNHQTGLVLAARKDVSGGGGAAASSTTTSAELGTLAKK